MKKEHSNTGWRRMALMIVMLMMTTVMASAQKLYVSQLFWRFGQTKGCKKVEMHDTELKGFRLDVYKSLTYGKRQKYDVNAMLMSDRRHAKKIREVIEDGRITSGYYMMPPLSNGRNRYILFSNNDDGRGAVIYIEGRLSPDDIMKICYGK